MRIMVISDIHGSASACKKVVDKFIEDKYDKLLILGDILYHGPRNDLPEGYDPKEVISLLNGIKDKIMCVKGNCDAEVDQMVLEFPIGSEYILIELGDKIVFATHGHNLEAQLEKVGNNADIILSGHTHVSKFEKVDGKIFVNPGSISLPKEDSAPAYAVLESARLFLKTNYRVSLKTLDDDTIDAVNYN